jgi:hypothetical protein
MRNQNKKIFIADDNNDKENALDEDIPLNHTE